MYWVISRSCSLCTLDNMSQYSQAVKQINRNQTTLHIPASNIIGYITVFKLADTATTMTVGKCVAKDFLILLYYCLKWNLLCLTHSSHGTFPSGIHTKLNLIPKQTLWRDKKQSPEYNCCYLFKSCKPISTEQWWRPVNKLHVVLSLLFV